MGNIKPIKHHPTWSEKLSQILIVVGVTFSSAAIFTIIGLLVGALLMDISFRELADYSAGNLDPNTINALKVFQFFSAIGIFLVPAVLIPILFREKAMKFLSLRWPRKISSFFLVFVLLLTIYPFVEWLIQFNKGMALPESLKFMEDWMKQAQSENARLIDAFLQMDSISDLLLNILVIAVVAAVAEEFFFRGLIQRMIYQWYGRVHLAIFVSAILFSAFHLQFYGFLPRFFLGLLFGYLLYFTGSIWVPVVAHFLNNFAGVMASYLKQNNMMGSSLNKDLSMEYPGATAIVSLLLGALIMFYLSRINKNIMGPEEKEKQGWKKIYTTSARQKAEIVKGALENEGIPTVILDKKDSSYQVFGEVELYVNPENMDEAERIIVNREL